MLKKDKGFQLPDYSREMKLRLEGYKFIAGIDEAGRGPLSGPVVAAAVILPAVHPPWLNLIKDSKELTPKRREYLFALICKEALAFSVGIVSPTIIDSINILQATFLAMERAVVKLPVLPDFILVDGFSIPDFKYSHEGIIKGDKLCLSIACASIVAKVCRDHMMEKLDKIYPGYGFAKNKGYGTREHISNLWRLGPSAIHRLSFAPVKHVIRNRE